MWLDFLTFTKDVKITIPMPSSLKNQEFQELWTVSLIKLRKETQLSVWNWFCVLEEVEGEILEGTGGQTDYVAIPFWG